MAWLVWRVYADWPLDDVQHSKRLIFKKLIFRIFLRLLRED
jgi:hypothetical protein